ncbi:hypothetical protein [Wenxinia saemankumensis]|uniref:Uncharacterized protein n=1 Tax=Wenxinia saemankumensis TaxID=1447782 RepID=A0A1M6C029_9RHOB|nr:hypothetical protein [Wenxinia saemankumensis]SHI54038.1 hypothetical protein SAMN05444417_0923 [Wenxinia saemankumensis]
MDHDTIAAMFTAPDGAFRFARWRRPLAPVVFGVDEATLAAFHGAFRALCTLAGRDMAETDPELGSNVMVFCCRDWAELDAVPDLDRLVGTPELGARLEAAGADRFRAFRFEADGAIRACFVFLRIDEAAGMEAATLALGETAQIMLAFAEGAFAGASPLALLPDGRAVLRPEIGALIAAAYDPVLPDASEATETALRLAARIAAGPGGAGG